MIEMFMTAQPASVLTKITGWAIVDDPAIAQHDCAVDEGTEWANVMQHDQGARARRQQPAEHVGEDALMLKINTRRGFVEHEEIWLCRQRPGNQDPLLLPARQPRNVGVELLRQPNVRDRFTYRSPISSRQRPEEPPTCQPSGCDDFLDLGPAEQRRRALRHVADPRPTPEVPQG
jgi:hypothetical protein